MARTKGANRPSRDASKSSKKKKRVASPEEAEESERHGPEYSSRHFVSRDAHLLYMSRYAHKKVLPGKAIDVDFFRNFPMMDWLRIQGWVELMGRKLPYYPNLVRIFYSNMTISMDDGEEILSSFVKGCHFRLTATDLNHLLGIHSSANVPRERLHPTQARAELLGANAGVRNPQASHLDEDTRLVMHLVNWIIRPISGHLTSITGVAARIVHNIKYGNEANLGRIMINHMGSLKNHKAGNMPYGMWLTLVFGAVGVDLEDEPHLELEEPHGTVGELTLRNMGLEPNEQGLWRRRPGAGVGPAPMGDDEEEEEEHGGEEPIDEDSMPRALEEEPGMRTSSSAGGDFSYMARFDALQEEMRATRDTLQGEMRATREDVWAIRDEVRSSREAHDELARSVLEHHAQADRQQSSLDSFTTSFNHFLQGYMAQYPSYFPPPPPGDES